MHSYIEQEEDSRTNRPVVVEVKYKNKPQISSALLHPVNVAVKLNAPVSLDTKLVKHKKNKSPKKGSRIIAALTAPLDVAVNVNTPDKTNVSLAPFRSNSLKAEKRKPKQCVLSGLIAPLNVAVNVNTPAKVKCPVIRNDTPRRSGSMSNPVSRPLSSSAYQRMDSTTSDKSLNLNSAPEIPKPPGDDFMIARRFNSTPNSILTLSGCSDSSCSSSLDDLSDSETCDIKPLDVYNKSKAFTSFRSIKSLKGPGSLGGSMRSRKRDDSRPSVTGGMMTFMDLAIQVNTPADARKVGALL